MVEIGGKPILWHIMKLYAHHGFQDFVICLGYKGYFIKEYFYNYFLHHNNVTIDMATNQVSYLNSGSEPWKVTLIDTGPLTQTGARIRKVAPFITGDTFFLTYGDGVSDVNIPETLAFHKSHGKLATVTSVQPTGRFGALQFDGDTRVSSFLEKPQGDGMWVNGGFFVLNKGVLDYIHNDTDAVWEKEPLEKLAKNDELQAYKHQGFWKPMDTLRDCTELHDMVVSKTAPWMVWES